MHYECLDIHDGVNMNGARNEIRMGKEAKASKKAKRFVSCVVEVSIEDEGRRTVKEKSSGFKYSADVNAITLRVPFEVAAEGV